MRILTRYILREVLSHAILGGIIFTFVLFMSKIGVILEMVVRNSASLGDVIRLIAYTLPSTLTVTIPMAVLVGILLGLSRLASDSEITAMRAAGMGANDFVRIVSIISVAALLLGLLNTLYLGPHAASDLLALENNLKSSQASFEVQPRVFYEDFKNYVLYVQDVTPASGAALWHHVFLADLTEPATPHITTADEAIVTPGLPGTIDLHLHDGSQHTIAPNNPSQYDISTFASTNLPIQTGAQDETHLSRSDTPIHALSYHALLNPPVTSPALARAYRIEQNKRFSYPFACLVLMLVGVPLGLSSKRGGKSTGFVITILLVFGYYLLSSVGEALAKTGYLPPVLGVWAANIVFAAAGILLLQQMARGGVALSIFSSLGVALSNLLARFSPSEHVHERDLTDTLPQRVRNALHIQFPLILDDYIMREFGANFALVLGSLSTLFLIFTFFELIGDIIKNRTPLVTVGDYLLNLVPFILYNVTPLCALVAVLITFGALSRSSELTAMKASGLSLYRIVTPVLVLTAVIAVALFTFDEFYLPAANRRQEGLRNIIKGKPPQTSLRPDRQWISGQTQKPEHLSFTFGVRHPEHTALVLTPKTPKSPEDPNAPAPVVLSPNPVRIFYYQFFDPDRDLFANLTVFEFDPVTFKLQRRTFAASARWDHPADRWVFENGWQRTFSGETIGSYQPFVLTTFPEIHEQPQYFKKEDRPSQEMAFGELSRYINDLRQSGFDTKRLSVQLNRKLAYPAITLVMAILAVPFALRTGKRGGVAGFAIAILLAVVYLGVSSLFEAMGNVNTLPPALAAWTPDLLFAFAGAYFLLRTPT